MPGWRDFLDRFRPAGAPGAAAPHGIPVDRAAVVAAELMPVLRRLDRVQDEADRVRGEARELAGRLRVEGGDEAVAIVQRARDSVETVAAQAASAAMTAARAEEEAEVADDAPEVTRRAAERLPGYVDRVVAAAHDLIAELSVSAHEMAPR